MTIKRFEPVFIVGCPRSGTTILQAMIANHPELVSFPETQLPFGFLNDHPWPPFRRNIPRAFQSRELWAFANRLGFCRKDSRAVLKRAVNALAVDQQPSGFRRRIRLSAAFKDYRKLIDSVAGDKRWIEKSPLNIFAVNYIEKYFPSARIVHIVREPREVVASLVSASTKHAPFRKFSGRDGWKAALKLWTDCFEVTYRSRSTSSHFVVTYERLTQNPSASLGEVFGFLNVPPFTDTKNVDIESVSRSDEKWKFEHGPVIKRQQPKSMKVLGAEVCTSIDRSASPLYSNLA